MAIVPCDLAERAQPLAREAVHEQRHEVLQPRAAERLQRLGHEALDRLGRERPGELVAQAFEPLLEVPAGDQVDVEIPQCGGHRSAPLRSPVCGRAACYLLTVVASIDRSRSMAIDLELAPKTKRPAGEPCCEPVVYPDVEREHAVRMAEVAKALGDPVRLQLVDVLRKHAGKVCVCELVPLFDISQPTLSHHLKKLREAGIVDSERRGLWAYYYVIPDALEELTAWLS